MAELYVGRAKGVAGSEKLVALKRILPEFAKDKRFVEMFLDEARINTTLQHPNIVQTYDVVKERDSYLLVMEFLEGADVKQYARKHLQVHQELIPIATVLQVILGVLSGLHYAHNRRDVSGNLLNIVHRDVSPQNVFLTHDGGIRLLDFGIAKASTAISQTETGVVKGKIHYMSPEQCVGGKMDHRADIYAAGVMLYELLTGHRVHKVKGNLALMKAIVDNEPVPPSQINSRVPKALDAIVMRALEKQRRQRYESARDFQLAIEGFTRSNNIYLSPLTLAKQVSEVLGPPQRSWNDPPTQSEVVPLGLPTEIRTQLRDDPTPAPLRNTPHADLIQHGDVILAQLKGRINETFSGRGIGKQLRGVVLLDLERVQRITSFGIRAWLDMIEASEGQVDAIYVARCPEVFINQVTMMRNLLGKGKIVSFYAPYLCPTTQQPMPVLLSGAVGLRAVRDHHLPKQSCPSGEAAIFDEDPISYLDFADQYDSDPPESIRALLGDDPSQAPRRAVEKTMERDHTLLRIQCDIDDKPSWRRLLSGLEGKVVLNFEKAGSSTAAGIKALVRGLEKYAEDVTEFTLLGLPPEIHEQFLTSSLLNGRMRVRTLHVPCVCRNCETERRVNGREAAIFTALQSGEPLADTCKLCNGPLAISPDGREALAYLVEGVALSRENIENMVLPPDTEEVTKPIAVTVPEVVQPASQVVSANPGCLGRLLGLFSMLLLFTTMAH